MYIAVSNMTVNTNPNNIYMTFTVVSAAGTSTVGEAYLDENATAAEMLDEIADTARSVCRANNEDVANDARVVIFGNIITVGV
jgi:hypothetical protein